MNNLIYTIAYDQPGTRTSRTMAKLLCGSILRSVWDGRIMIFKNFEEPIFSIGRPNLQELQVQCDIDYNKTGTENLLLKAALEARILAGSWIENPEQYDWIVYLDADCLALRDMRYLLYGDVDVLAQPERKRPIATSKVFNGYIGKDEKSDVRINGRGIGRNGVNAGTFAIRGHKFASFTEEWLKVFHSEPEQHEEFRDQTAFNKVLLDGKFTCGAFESGGIQFPFNINSSFLAYKRAAVLHFIGGTAEEKVQLSFALYMMLAFCDGRGLFLDFLEQ